MKKVLQELRNIALVRPLDFVTWTDGKLELKNLEDIPKKRSGAVARIERNTSGIRIVFHDKLKACELLLRFSDNGLPAEENNLLEAILESTRAPFGSTAEIDELEGVAEDDNGIFVATGD